ncbi:MAG: LolA family protein [Bacteroidales bacterium]
MKQKYALIGWFLLLAFPLLAQNRADEILKKAESAYMKDGAVKASFTADVIQKKGDASSAMEGTVYMNGAKFYLSSSDLNVWYDGKDQWVLLANSDEVNLTQPTEDEMAAMNPAIFFRQYNKGFKSSLKGDKLFMGVPCTEILLVPDKTNTGILKLTIYIDKTSYRIKGLTVENTNGMINKIQIKNYQSSQKFSDSIFRFDASQYPQVEIIDLR